ncbi:hypothetical protein [Nesterenkonia populi]|uniref:hypothetical protein n=1 Tax=Nesterenkonia populi TaxID=1591087 RepID=UPI0011BED6E1|nr:hypothetical protein [Nesterenkonia populi]
MSRYAAPQTFARRQLATVLIDGLCPVGLGVSEHLARQGVGTVLVRDAALVSAEEADEGLGCSGFRAHEVGRSREDAAAGRLGAQCAGAEVMAAPEEFGTAGVDLQVSVGKPGAVMSRLGAAGLEHPSLPVQWGAEAWSVGPLLGPDAGACPECLLPAPSVGGFPSCREAEHDAHPVRAAWRAPAAASLVGALAAQQVLTLIDGEHPAAAEGRILSGSLASGELATAPVSVVEGCDCLFARV